MKAFTKKEQLRLIKKSQTDRKTLAKDCMNLWQKIVKLRAKGVCEYPNCYKTTYLNAHHFFSRSNAAIRYDLDNGLCLCSGCHSLNNHSAHKDPEFCNKILGLTGDFKPIRSEAWLNKLRLKASSSTKLDLKLELLFLEQEYKRYAKWNL